MDKETFRRKEMENSSEISPEQLPDYLFWLNEVFEREKIIKEYIPFVPLSEDDEEYFDGFSIEQVSEEELFYRFIGWFHNVTCFCMSMSEQWKKNKKMWCAYACT